MDVDRTCKSYVIDLGTAASHEKTTTGGTDIAMETTQYTIDGKRVYNVGDLTGKANGPLNGRTPETDGCRCTPQYCRKHEKKEPSTPGKAPFFN